MNQLLLQIVVKMKIFTLILASLPLLLAQNVSDYRVLKNAPPVKINMNNYTNTKESVIAVGNAVRFVFGRAH
jgi:hypothetical protein